jgi:hypothetical protein
MGKLSAICVRSGRPKLSNKEKVGDRLSNLAGTDKITVWFYAPDEAPALGWEGEEALAEVGNASVGRLLWR